MMTLKNSVITRTELSHQQQTQPRWLTGFYALMLALSGFAFVASFVLEPMNARRDDAVGVILVIYYILLAIFHFGVLIHTLKVSSEAIMREKRTPERWEALMLTGVIGREIVFGKWWAIVRTQWRTYLLLGLVRTVAAVTFPTIGRGLGPYYSYFSGDVFHVTLEGAGLAALVLITMTLINLPYTAACGIVAAMWTERGGIGRSIILRTVLTIGAAFLPMLLWTIVGIRVLLMNGLISETLFNEIHNFNSSRASFMMDNGMSLGAEIAVNSIWLVNHVFLSIAAFVLSLLTYVVLSWVMLRVAQWRAERIGALHPNEPTATNRNQQEKHA
jgi:hypothetical protein